MEEKIFVIDTVVTIGTYASKINQMKTWINAEVLLMKKKQTIENLGLIK